MTRYLALALFLLYPALSSGLDLKRNYERALIDWGLREANLVEDPHPAGKRIERIVIVRENIIASHDPWIRMLNRLHVGIKDHADPWPDFLNYLHAKTRDSVIRQEMLVAVGDRWDGTKVEETERNLRSLFILAVARAVPCRGSDPSKVVLLVVTKDLWSIRLNMAFSQTGSVIRLFDFQPTEGNFLGLNKELSLHLRLSQIDLAKLGDNGVHDHFTVGQRYRDPRLFSTRLQLRESFDVYIDGQPPCAGARGEATELWCPIQKTGAFGGINAELTLARPLFSLSTKWAFAVEGVVNFRQRRTFRFNSASNIPLGEIAGISVRTVSLTNHTDGEDRAVPLVYDGKYILGAASVTRSLGTFYKHDFSGGFVAYDKAYQPPENFPFDVETRDWFIRNHLPRSESAAYVFLRYRFYTGQHIRLHGINGFALSEDYWLGPWLSLESRFAQNLHSRTQSYIHLSALFGYRWHRANNLLSVALSAQSRWQPELNAYSPVQGQQPWVDGQFAARIKNISPPLWIGRLHVEFSLLYRHNDQDNNKSNLGGESTRASGASFFDIGNGGLRGYPAEFVRGPHLFRANLEYRSKPINLWTIHGGFVVFYEGGSVFGNGEAFEYLHSVGAGVRIQVPQFDKESFRLDFGIPLTPGAGDIGTWFSLSFGQVF